MEKIVTRKIKINRTNPNGINPVHINDMVVSHDDKEFFLQFSEIEPPTFYDTEELNKIECVDAVIKVKLVMSPECLDEIIKALEQNLKKYKLRRALSHD